MKQTNNPTNQNSNHSNNQSLFELHIPPLRQALVGLAAAFVFMILYQIFKLAGADMGIKFPWTTSGAVILMYAVFNSVNSFTTNDMLKYYRNSIFAFIGLAAGSGAMAYLFSGTSINEAGTFRWIYVMLALSYFGFIGITTFIRFIFNILQTEEEKLSRRIDDK